MSKSQFLTLLSEKLSEELPRDVVLGNLEYYQNYIDGELAKGRSEEAIMEELGDPYMIARTIIDTQTGESFVGEESAEEVYTESNREYDDLQRRKGIVISNQNCLIPALIIMIVVIAVLGVLGSIVSFLWPILGPLLFILLLVWLFRRNQ